MRAYTGADAQATLTVFLRAVRETAKAHHTPEQIEAWAAEGSDLDGWAEARSAVHTVLAVIDDEVVGFADVDDDGYIDMLFVRPDLGRHGVASALLEWVITLARRQHLPVLTSYASLTSRPVFERHGFVITGERYLGEGGGATKTCAMRCELGSEGER